MIVIDGKSDTIAAHARALGVLPHVLRNRAAALGGDYQRAADETRARFGEWKRGPKRGTPKPWAAIVDVDGERRTVSEWALRLGLTRKTLDNRKSANGWTWEQTIRASIARPGVWPRGRVPAQRRAA